MEKHGIPNHFVHSMSDTSFLAKRADMIPLECVARRIAYGSYLKRNPGTSEGEKFEKPIVEFFFKDDAKHDPYVALDPDNAQGVLYNPKHPIQRGAHMGVIPFSDLGADIHRLRIMKHLTRKVFETLEDAWAIQNVALVDLKIEFGQDINGNLMVADVIDNDSWRIWPNGDKTKMLDKQLYRDGSNLKLIIQNYQKVAEMTKNF